MDTVQLIVISIMVVLAITACCKIGWEASPRIILWDALLSFICLLSITILCILVVANTQLNKKLDAKFPKLEKVEDVYRIKNK